FSCVGTSAGSSGTGWKPLLTYHWYHLSLPFVEYSFAPLTSASECSGFFENTCSQPALPQQSRWKPLASRRCWMTGVSLRSTAVSSSGDSRKNGMPKTLNGSRSSAGPRFERNDACRTSVRIFLMAVASSPCCPPANTVSVTRPPVSRFHALPMSSSALCQLVPAGTSVDSLTFSTPPAEGGITAAAIATTQRYLFSIVSVSCLLLCSVFCILYSVFSFSLREHRVDVIEQRLRAALLDERHQPSGRILLRVDSERLLQERLELPAILRGRRDADRERHVRAGRGPVLELDGAFEMRARAFSGAAERLRLAVERDEHLVERSLAPWLVERDGAVRERADDRQIDHQIRLVDAERDGRAPRRGHPVEQRHVFLARPLQPRPRVLAHPLPPPPHPPLPPP